MSKNLEIFEKVQEKSVICKAISWTLQIVLGSLFLALMAQVAFPIPFSLVPVTFQTLGVALLAIALGSQKAPWAVACYLSEASMGFPVLAGGAVNPLWMLGPRSGYLIGFMISAYVISKLLESQKESNFLKNWLCVISGEAVVLGIGWLGLSYYVGFGNAFITGVLPFIPGALVKTFAATSTIKPIAWVKEVIAKL